MTLWRHLLDCCPDCLDPGICSAESECVGRRDAATDSSPTIPEWDDLPLGSHAEAQRTAVGRGRDQRDGALTWT